MWHGARAGCELEYAGGVEGGCIDRGLNLSGLVARHSCGIAQSVGRHCCRLTPTRGRPANGAVFRRVVDAEREECTPDRHQHGLSANKEIVAHSLGEVRSFLDELKNGTKKYKTVASLSGQIAEAYRGRCVLELLQNAHDALADPPDGDRGRITFALETEPVPVLLIANSGRAFEQKDFKGLCQLGQSPKDPKRSVGNKGLGFRSVLEVASAPEIWSTAATEGGPEFVFRFDPGVRDKIATALDDLNEHGLQIRSPFNPSERLVDWTKGQLRKYRERLAEGDVGWSGRGEGVPVTVRHSTADRPAAP